MAWKRKLLVLWRVIHKPLLGPQCHTLILLFYAILVVPAAEPQPVVTYCKQTWTVSPRLLGPDHSVYKFMHIQFYSHCRGSLPVVTSFTTLSIDSIQCGPPKQQINMPWLLTKGQEKDMVKAQEKHKESTREGQEWDKNETWMRHEWDTVWNCHQPFQEEWQIWRLSGSSFLSIFLLSIFLQSLNGWVYKHCILTKSLQSPFKVLSKSSKVSQSEKWALNTLSLLHIVGAASCEQLQNRHCWLLHFTKLWPKVQKSCSYFRSTKIL
jgi:hypothetical protein